MRGATREEQMTYSPEVVDKEVEDAENDHEKSGAELGLETDDNHDAGASTQDADNDAPDGPAAAEDEAEEQENQQDTASQLEVHLPVLLVQRGETGKRLGLANPRVGQDHNQAADDGQVAEEEVEVEDETVAESLGDDDTHEAGDGVVRVLSDDDEGGAGNHGNHVGQKEEVGDAGGDCGVVSRASVAGGKLCLAGARLTVPVVAQVKELVAPLRHDAESILEEGNDDEESANGRQVTVERWSG